MLNIALNMTASYAPLLDEEGRQGVGSLDYVLTSEPMYLERDQSRCTVDIFADITIKIKEQRTGPVPRRYANWTTLSQSLCIRLGLRIRLQPLALFVPMIQVDS